MTSTSIGLGLLEVAQRIPVSFPIEVSMFAEDEHYHFHVTAHVDGGYMVEVAQRPSSRADHCITAHAIACIFVAQPGNEGLTLGDTVNDKYRTQICIERKKVTA